MPPSVVAPERHYNAGDVINFMQDTQKRLDKLEDFARLMTDPDLKQAPTSLLRPISPQPAIQQAAPQQGNEVRSANPALKPGEATIDPSAKMQAILQPRAKST